VTASGLGAVVTSSGLGGILTSSGLRPVILAGVVAVAVLLVVLLWPGRRPPVSVLASRARPDDVASVVPRSGLAALWHEDPVELWRRRRRLRGGEPFERAVLALLDATAAALRAGLPPVRALELAGAILPSESPAAAVELVERAVAVSARGQPVAPIWRVVAEQTGSSTVDEVAAAWGLSETTGCPLAEAVERAAAQLRSALATRRKVRAAVAGPQATVTVLTVLPLTGPLFGLACGVPPGELYGNAIGLSCLGAGLVLIVFGREWCRRLVRRAEQPS
jgi:tight adherence protein B